MIIRLHSDILERTTDNVWIRKGDYEVVRKVPARSPTHYLIKYNTRLILMDINRDKYVTELIGEDVSYF